MFEQAKRSYHFFLAWLGSVVYRYPSREIFVIGITGTKGKSSTAELISAMLESNGKKVALLSSVRKKIGEESEPNSTGNTMPGRFFIQQFQRRAVKAKCSHVILEVTSQGVVQSRHKFIDFDAALFTNLHPEHIESHGSFENYRAAKVSFFHNVARSRAKEKKIFVINREDSSNRYFFEAVHGLGEIYYVDRKEFLARFPKNKFSAWLMADFNIENAATAAKIAEVIGVPRENIRQTLERFQGVPGRMEIVQESPFRLVIDYAHTPESLEKVYTFLSKPPSIDSSSKKLSNSSSSTAKLICVLGSAGGGRDTWKRKAFGRIAAEYCRQVIITDEDPYDEDPETIAREIIEGILESPKRKKITPHEIMLDRKAAIERAIALARRGDTVVITGKGSESRIHLKKGETIPWSDREIAKEALRLKKEETRMLKRQKL